MGFKTVYEVLLELFPKVDSRLLKAVSIEHSKDADVAAEVVVSEILPYVSRIHPDAYPVHEECNPANPPDEEDEYEEETSKLRHWRSDPKKSAGSSSEPTSEAKEDGSDTEANSAFLTDSTCQEKAFNHPEVSQQGNVESEELILLGKSPHWEADYKKVCPITELEVPVSLGKDQNINFNSGHDPIYQDAESCLIQENGVSSGSLADRVESDLDDDVSNMENPVVEPTPDAAECDLGSQFSGISMNDSHQGMSKQDKIDFLDEIVEAAKNNKKTLFSAMESVMNMMREVEIREKAAEVAQEEAARGGLDILVKVEELKQMLAHAREANDMHAGEVYGEKAILATEVKELQARLFSLSEERDRALSILDEMHQTLEARLTAADELRKSAELEKMEKEESAQKLLSEQEAIMEKVVQESKILQQEAEENSKLREFLMDRGHIVDSLQGEISVICQDVRLLKEKFDERVPLSKSISSSQTSCILASSGSSLKSMAPDLVPELGVATKSPKNTSPVSSINGQSPRSRTSSVHGQSARSLTEEERRDDNRKELLDDDWDFFENEMEM